jgi:hypothetical protein
MPTNTENFRKYKNEVLVETGSFLGDGISQALEAGFNQVISIELSDKYFDLCISKFEKDSRVKIVKGDSYKILPEVIQNIDKRITFWLDGHHSCGDTALGDYWAPLIQELEVIKGHPIKDHTIMIDDMRCWELPNPVHGFFKEDIFEKLREINSNYKFDYLDGSEPKDILVAYI